jgi:hypothetical protein
MRRIPKSAPGILVSRFQFIPILLSRSFEFLFQVFNFCGNFGQYVVALTDIPFFLVRDAALL